MLVRRVKARRERETRTFRTKWENIRYLFQQKTNHRSIMTFPLQKQFYRILICIRLSLDSFQPFHYKYMQYASSCVYVPSIISSSWWMIWQSMFFQDFLPKTNNISHLPSPAPFYISKEHMWKLCSPTTAAPAIASQSQLLQEEEKVSHEGIMLLSREECILGTTKISMNFNLI